MPPQDFCTKIERKAVFFHWNLTTGGSEDVYVTEGCVTGKILSAAHFNAFYNGLSRNSAVIMR